MKTSKKPKPPRKMFIIGLDMFPYDCLVAINKTPEQVQKMISKYNKPIPDDHIEIMRGKRLDTALYLFNDKFNTSVIYIKSSSVTKTVTLFAHEHIHFLHHVFTAIGNLKLSDETEEVYAYASEHLMTQFLSKY